MTRARSRTQIAQQLQRAVGGLTKSSLGRMEREMPWFEELPAEHRAWIGMILQAGYNNFITWFREPSKPNPALAAEVFGTAPRSFAGVITLQQTVAMIRLSIDVAEAEISTAVAPEHAEEVRASILRYGRELAFATADVYAHAAELRGAWDARLEALVVDSIMRGDADESVRTRASALGWQESGNVAVVVGLAPGPEGESSAEPRRRGPRPPPAPPSWPRSAPSRATVSWWCSAGSSTRTRPAPSSRRTSARVRSSSGPS